MLYKCQTYVTYHDRFPLLEVLHVTYLRTQTQEVVDDRGKLIIVTALSQPVSICASSYFFIHTLPLYQQLHLNSLSEEWLYKLHQTLELWFSICGS